MDKPELTQEQINFAVGAFTEYLRFIERIEPQKPMSLTRVAINTDHSALLRRLLSGKKPLEVAPPKSYSYPDYAMAEGEVVTGEMFEVGEEVVVNQSRTWVRDPNEKDVLIHTSGLRVRYWLNEGSQASFNKYKFQKI